MGLVVEHHDRRPVVQITQHAAGEGVRALLALVHHDVALAALGVRALRRELVPVGDQHLALVQLGHQLRRDDVEGLVVVVLDVGAQHLQALEDGEVRAHHQRRIRKTLIARMAAAVAEGPGDQHRHNDRLAAAGGHLAAVAGQGGAAVLIGLVRQGRKDLGRLLEDEGGLAARHQRPVVLQRELRLGPKAHPAGGENFVEVDDRFDGLTLAEEQAPRAVGSGPVRQQLPRHRRRVRVIRLPPAPHVLAQQIDQRQVVPLLFGEQRHLHRAGALGLEPV